MKSAFSFLLVFLCSTCFGGSFVFQEQNASVFSVGPPIGFEEMWQGFDPRAEPLEIETLKEWEQESVVMRIVRYRIGDFKGKRSMMAAVYGFPKEGSNLPALLQVHGGGQYADHRPVLHNAKRGYATLSIAWAGRISSPNYHVSPEVVRLFWEGKSDDPRYRLTTDWGALDAYHAPSRHGKDAFSSLPVENWTIDPFPSPRNSSWYLIALAGRRGLTFLERQPEVDGSRLGVYGHSMGGKLTVMIAGADSRVGAAAPSCGGISDRYAEDELRFSTIGDPSSLRNISCPIAFLSPSNDFHGRINDLEAAIREIKSTDWRITSSPHHNHQDTAEFEALTQLWFDQHLKKTILLPRTPVARLYLQAEENPKFTVRVDDSQKVRAVEVYYTQQGKVQVRGALQDDSSNTKHRFWRFVQPIFDQESETWKAELPLYGSGRNLWAYANVLYELEEPVFGAGYYHGFYDTQVFNLSSLLQVASSEELVASEVPSRLSRESLIESFADEWRHHWFSYDRSKWGLRTNKLYEDQWSAPEENSLLSIEVRSSIANKLALWIDNHGVELSLLGNDAWQRFLFSCSDFLTAEGKGLSDWRGIKEFRIDGRENLTFGQRGKGATKTIGGDWQGEPPEFANLRWVAVSRP